jgi:hypothetical protein
MDVFALEDCGEDQHLFQQLMREHPVFNLPSQVRAAAAKTNMDAALLGDLRFDQVSHYKHVSVK